MRPWWDKIAGAADEYREPPKRPQLGPSIYENRDSAAPKTVIVATSGPQAGRILGYEVDGKCVKGRAVLHGPGPVRARGVLDAARAEPRRL